MDLGRIAELALPHPASAHDGTWGELEADASSITTRPTTIPSGSGGRARSTSARPATRRSWSSTPRRPDRPALPDRRSGSAAEAADHVVEDRQAPAQGVDRDALVDAVEPLEEALVRVEPQRREAVGRRADARRCAWRRSRTGAMTGSGIAVGIVVADRRDEEVEQRALGRRLDRGAERRSARSCRRRRARARAARRARRASPARSSRAGRGSRPRPRRRPG